MTLLYGIMSYYIMDNSSCSTSFTSNQDVDSPLGLIYYYSGIQSCSANHYWMGVRDHYVIHFVLDGCGMCYYGGQEYLLEKRQAFLIRPREKVHYTADSFSPWRYCWVAFSGASSSSLLKKTAFSTNNPITGFGDPEIIENNIEKLLSLQPAMKNKYFLEAAYLLEIFSQIEAGRKNVSERTDNRKKHMDIAINFIQRNYSGYITVEDIAKHVGIDRKYLSSISKNLLGISTQQYLLDKRMREAMVLLTNSELSIKEIAHSVGYRDALLFSKMFKKKYGISPMGFRNISALKQGT